MPAKRKSVSFLELDSTAEKDKIVQTDHEHPEQPPTKRPKVNGTATNHVSQWPQLPHQPKPQPNPQLNPITQTLLSVYYPQTLTLRQYALSKLPKSFKIRRKKIAAVGLSSSSSSSRIPDQGQGQGPEKPSAATHQKEGLETALGNLLDTTLVCFRLPLDAPEKKEKSDYRWEQWVSFSQGQGTQPGGAGGNKGDESHVTLSDGLRGGLYSQGDIVDFVVWLLFSRSGARGKTSNGYNGLRHLLCDGFRKGIAPPGRQAGEVEGGGGHQIPGVYAVHTNQCVKALKETPWPQFLLLLGKEGERIMLDLLLDCAVFANVKEGKGNLVQVSGVPVSELQPWTADSGKNGAAAGEGKELSPSEITFARNRMLYARAALNARGLVSFGLRHIHVLNRMPCKPPSEGEERSKPDESTTHVMMYIFPRQFGLHNVFTSTVDRQQTAQKFQDYTLREEEIAKNFPKPAVGEKPKVKIPKRLRGKMQELVHKLQVLHGRCSYAEMLQYYCPLPKLLGPEQMPQSCQLRITARSSKSSQKKSKKTLRPPFTTQVASQPNSQSHALLDLATPISSISAFCQAVLSKIVPNDFWGSPDSDSDGPSSAQEHNKTVFLKHVNQFIKLRRFESMCLHQVVQGMKIKDISWLIPPPLQNKNCSQSDLAKRREIFLEFLYYVFDSLLIPLIRSNFYVTESSAHRYRLFFFRHDVWLSVTKPALTSLKVSMFEEVKMVEAVKILEGRKLGFSQVRLLPKGVGSNLRPIMNLRRRVLLRGVGAGGGSKVIGGKQLLGPSINSVLGPVNSMLKFEKRGRPGMLGGGMFAVGDIYERMKGFRARFFPNSEGKEKGGEKKRENGKSKGKFYFVKVDVQAAFDTIPQEAIVELLEKIPGHAMYKESKHVEVTLPLDYDPHSSNPDTTGNTINKNSKPKPTKRWHSTTTPFPPPPPTSNTKTSILPQSDLPKQKENTLFIPSHSSTKLHTSSSLLSLAKEHITQNLVKIGKKYYRQKTGIPQGSVLSSTLCNYFYADLERSQGLAFLDLRPGTGDGNGEAGTRESENARGVSRDGETLLMRLIDDFLLITTNKQKAKKFVEAMHRGFPEYGVTVSAHKSLVNFDVPINGTSVPRLAGGSNKFPYCGLTIDTQTLEICKPGAAAVGATATGAGNGADEKRDPVVFNSITVEYSKNQGRNFKRKVLNAFKIQSHLLFFDISHNSFATMLRNLYVAFVETAIKMWAHARCLSSHNLSGTSNKRVPAGMVIETIKSLIEVAYRLLTSRSRKERYPGYMCSVGRGQVAWLCMVACRQVLVRKQAGYKEVIKWLEGEVEKLGRERKMDTRVLVKVAGEVAVRV